jgi:hypothetical protein
MTLPSFINIFVGGNIGNALKYVKKILVARCENDPAGKCCISCEIFSGGKQIKEKI